jgi:flagellar motor protein MotB
MESWMRGFRHLCGWLLGSAILALTGCAQTPYAQGQAAATTAQAAQLAQQTKQLEEQRKALDNDNKELETMLAQSRQQTRLVQDQYAAVREQMSSMNTQLAQLRDERKGLEQKLETTLANSGGNNGGTGMAKKPGVFSNSSLPNKLPDFSVAGIETRMDDGVIRIELPADRLFSPADARLRLDSVQLLDNVVVEIERNYPHQYVAIEGHSDNEPPQSTAWLNNHQISTARAAAVFDYLVQKTRLRPNQLFIVGHGANHPVVSNATSAGRARNRRIELVIYPERIGDK